MKALYFLFVFLLIISCQSPPELSYAERVDKCRQEAMKHKTFVSSECVVGASIPEIDETTFEGKQINPDYFKGKFSIINFWFITCPPCVAEIPGLNALVEKYGKKDVNYLAIGRDTDNNIQEFLTTHPWQFDMMSNGQTAIESDFKFSWGYPMTFILDRDARIISAFGGGKTDSTAIDEIQQKISAVLDKELL